MTLNNNKNYDEEALAYHAMDPPGKLSVVPTKPLTSQVELALAYSPGVAAACNAIKDDPLQSYKLTSRSNLVAVVTNGTAVLGLGDIGPEASKPVMEGKAVLFKQFAGIDCFDIEIDELDVDKFCACVSSLQYGFGGINLEDIKAPECFIIEKKLQETMKIPVFHDDQHGTAICASAALSNALILNNKKISEIKIICNGAGAAGIACLDMFRALGAQKKNIFAFDRQGLITLKRVTQNDGVDPFKAQYAQDSEYSSLIDVIADTDVFLGCSVGNALSPDMLRKMNRDPIILALANPTPEIAPELAKDVRKDCIIATGRSDYPNQVNNVLCFPFIFRGALDVGATSINTHMKMACSNAIAAIARKEVSDPSSPNYDDAPDFNIDNLIPKPFDKRLVTEVSFEVAKAAIQSGVATRPIKNYDNYRDKLSSQVYKSGSIMKPIFDKTRHSKKNIVYAEGENHVVLHAVNKVIQENIARPILVGRPKVVLERIKRLRLPIKYDIDFDICNPEDDPRFREYHELYFSLMQRKGVTPEKSKTTVRSNNTAIAALMLQRNEAQGLICGTLSPFKQHLDTIVDIIGIKEPYSVPSAMTLLIMLKGTLFITDTHVINQPNNTQLVHISQQAIEKIKDFNITPSVALLSHSNFGSRVNESARYMAQAVTELQQLYPQLQIDGEMHGDTAFSQEIRKHSFPFSKLQHNPNLLVMPNIESANISYNLLKILANGTPVGPILLGPKKPAHVLTTSATPQTVLNMTAITVAETLQQSKLQTQSP